MIYDCFTFNDELDLLELRLEYLNPVVDKFVIVESQYTFSGLKKTTVFEDSRQRFAKYADKIVYIQDSKEPNTDAWLNEFHQRNLLKAGLKEAADDDLAIISDVDEIPYLSKILKDFSLSTPQIIPMTLSYYYFNCIEDGAIWDKAIITPYKFIKDIEVGDRDELRRKLQIRLNYVKPYGGHFSYLFGDDVEKYINKIKSFSHQEYNTPFFLNRGRIRSSIKNSIDLYGRYNHIYSVRTDLIDKNLIQLINASKADLLKRSYNLFRKLFCSRQFLLLKARAMITLHKNRFHYSE
jgi:beta-1,4-mannosyl-glycoprotein beta-1,4-N-acetylglucosaminyltransferase